MKRRTEETPEESKKQRVEEDKSLAECVKSNLEEETPVSEEKNVAECIKSQVEEETPVSEEKNVAECVKSKVEEETTVDDDSMLREYVEKMRLSHGYYAIHLPYHKRIRTCFFAEYDDRTLREVSEAAINFFNEANQGSDFVFHSVVMGNWSPCAGRFFRITFRARPSKSNHTNDDDIKEFKAPARYCPFENIRVHVCKCTVNNTREYPIYFEQNELTEFAEEAVRFFNQNHEGSHFVLHSVGKGDYTPIVCSFFRITFTAKASNEEKIKEFVARVKRSYPWIEPSCITVLECIFKEDEDDVKEYDKIKMKKMGHNPHPLHTEYDQKLRDSIGYYAVPLPPRLKVDVEVFPEYDEVFLEEVSEVAIKFYNEANGSDFVFHSLVMGNYNHPEGKFYRVTFRARPSKSNETDDIKEFRARVSYCLWEKNPICVLGCTVKSKREYPIDFEQKELIEFSEDALQFFNQKHEGSHFVFHSVVKSSNYIPISGYSVFVTFMASNDGNEDDIKEFEAILRLNFPWRQSTRATVVDCSLKDEAEYPVKPESESSKGKEKVGAD